jgi:hypothetical protein
MERPPVQTVSVARLRDRRLIMFCTIGFLIPLHRKHDGLNAAAQQKEKKQSASFSPALLMILYL